MLAKVAFKVYSTDVSVVCHADFAQHISVTVVTLSCKIPVLLCLQQQRSVDMYAEVYWAARLWASARWQTPKPQIRTPEPSYSERIQGLHVLRNTLSLRNGLPICLSRMLVFNVQCRDHSAWPS